MGKNKRKKRKNAAARRARAKTQVVPKQEQQDLVILTPEPVTLMEEPTLNDLFGDDCLDNVVSTTEDVVEDDTPESSNWLFWLYAAVLGVILIALIILCVI